MLRRGYLAAKHNLTISVVTCINVCHKQNVATVKRASELNVSDRINAVEASFDETSCTSNHYDLAFSQDTFIHVVSPKKESHNNQPAAVTAEDYDYEDAYEDEDD